MAQVKVLAISEDGDGVQQEVLLDFTENVRQQILKATDLQAVNTVLDAGTINERITQTVYSAASVGAMTAVRVVNYAQANGLYYVTDISWSIV